MNRRGRAIQALALAVIVVLTFLPTLAAAQEAWPPLQVQSTIGQTGNPLRIDLRLQNVSLVDLEDVVVAVDLPPGTTFQRFEAVPFATTQFDGKTLAFTVIKVPANQTVGPLSYYVDAQGTGPETLKTKVFASWRGQTPGEIVIPELAIGGSVAASAPSPAAAEATTPPAPDASPAPSPAETAVVAAEATEAAPAPALTPAPAPPAPATHELLDTLAKLKSYNWVDLTHAFAPGIPRWPGFPDAEFKTIYNYDRDGFFAQEFVHVGQFGTHMDPPAHFHKGLRTIDQIELKEMVAPLCVFNAADKVAANPDYQLTVDDVKAWEAQYGPVPEGAFVAMRSDWSKRWPDPDAYANKDDLGQSHYPGWTIEALKYLYEERKIVGNGHEPPDTDAALAQVTTGFAAETYVLGTDHYQIELLANLDLVPEFGAVAFIVVPKPLGGSGFPARVFAIVP